jgi:hypothetical protein
VTALSGVGGKLLGLGLTAAAVTLAACTAGPVPAPSAAGPVPAPSAGAASLPKPGGAATIAAAASCPSEAERTATEIQGAGDGVSLWALLFLTGPRLVSGKETKIVWRMTGAGDLTIEATGPDGRTAEPRWLETHGDSTWSRPGDEWGTGWVFPAAGCWTVRAVRDGGASAVLTLRVSA